MWVTEKTYDRKIDKMNEWVLVAQVTLESSYRELRPIPLSRPFECRTIPQWDSTCTAPAPGDQAIVYDNERRGVTHRDQFISVLPGCAHISNRPFSSRGMWGWAWRPRRAFVGKLSYGVRYMLWRPALTVANSFPTTFGAAAFTLLCCGLREESPLNRIPNSVIYYIINMVPWHWFDGAREEVAAIEEARDAGSDDEDEGIGWHRYGYRRMIQEHMNRYIHHDGTISGSSEEEDNNDDDSDYVPMDDDDDDNMAANDDDRAGFQLGVLREYLFRATGRTVPEGPGQVRELLAALVEAGILVMRDDDDDDNDDDDDDEV